MVVSEQGIEDDDSDEEDLEQKVVFVRGASQVVFGSEQEVEVKPVGNDTQKDTENQQKPTQGHDGDDFEGVSVVDFPHEEENAS